MAKSLAQPDCGGAPRRTNASDAVAGESGAGKKGWGVALTPCALTPGPNLWFIFMPSLGSPGVLVVQEEEGGFVCPHAGPQQQQPRRGRRPSPAAAPGAPRSPLRRQRTGPFCAKSRPA